MPIWIVVPLVIIVAVVAFFWGMYYIAKDMFNF